jgi:hypothetical protein
MESRDTSASAARPPRSTRTLWLVLALCVAPIVASYIAYYFWRPSGHVNYGELIEPRQLPRAAAERLDGSAFDWPAELKGQWVLMAAGPSDCDEKCREKLVYMRQVRLAQGKETDRIDRVWLLTDSGTPAAALIAEHPGLVVLRHAEPLVAALPATASPLDHVYVVDPLGHLMMRFPANPDPRKMLKDVTRLLRHSKWAT